MFDNVIPVIEIQNEGKKQAAIAVINMEERKYYYIKVISEIYVIPFGEPLLIGVLSRVIPRYNQSIDELRQLFEKMTGQGTKTMAGNVWIPTAPLHGGNLYHRTDDYIIQYQVVPAPMAMNYISQVPGYTEQQNKNLVTQLEKSGFESGGFIGPSSTTPQDETTEPKEKKTDAFEQELAQQEKEEKEREKRIEERRIKDAEEAAATEKERKRLKEEERIKKEEEEELLKNQEETYAYIETANSSLQLAAGKIQELSPGSAQDLDMYDTMIIYNNGKTSYDESVGYYDNNEFDKSKESAIAANNYGINAYNSALAVEKARQEKTSYQSLYGTNGGGNGSTPATPTYTTNETPTFTQIRRRLW